MATHQYPLRSRKMEYQTFEHDVLVIGAGGAGLRAAIEASSEGVSVGPVSYTHLRAHETDS